MKNPPVFQCCRPELLLAAVDGDASVFLELAQVFHQETVTRFDDIARASASGALNEMGYEAHSLKGTVGAVGATGLVQLLRDIEVAGLEQRRPCSAGQLAQLQQQLQAARDDMDLFIALLKEPGSSA